MGTVYCFEKFEFSIDTRELRKFGVRVTLQPQPAAILVQLLQHPGQVVRRSELRSTLWDDSVFVDYERNLNRSLNKLRQVLGDSADNPLFIETIPGVGYRFIAKVTMRGPELPVVPTSRDEKRLAAQADLSPTAAKVGSTGRFRAVPIALTIVCLALITSVATIAVRQRPQAHRIAILPVSNLSGNSNEDVIADGMTEELTEAISRIAGADAAVISRTTAARYKGTQKSSIEIGRELHATYVLESSLRTSQNRYRITAQLIRTSDDTHVWSSSFNIQSANPVDVQAEVALQVAEHVSEKLGKPSAIHRQSASAELAYRKAKYLFSKRTPVSLQNSLKLFEEAAQLDPQYANAQAGIAQAYLVLGGGYVPSVEAYAKGREAALKALTLDPECADAHTALAYYKFISEWDWSGAEAEYRRALDLDPSNVTAHHWYAVYLAAFRRFDEALTHIDRALELNPASVSATYNKGMILIQAGRYQEAIQLLRSAEELEPGSPVTPGYLAIAYEQLGMLDDSEQQYREAQHLSASPDAYSAGIARVHALRGDTNFALSLVASLKDHPSNHACEIALIYASLGDKTQTIKWLGRAVEERTCTITEYNTSHVFDMYRHDPEFRALGQRLKIPNT